MEFSIHRVWLLCKKQWAENQHIYILSMLATAGVVGIILFSFALTNGEAGENDYMQEDVFIGTFLIIGGILTVTILSQFNNKIKGVQALTLPASALEKIFTAIFFVLIIFPLLYIIVVYPVIVLVHYIDVGPLGHINALYTLRNFIYNGQVGVYFILQAVIMVFSVLFKRYTAVKTVLAIIVSYLAILSINNSIAKRMIHLPEGAHNTGTANDLTKQQLDSSLYIKANVHAIVYSSNHEKIKEKNVTRFVAGVISSSPPYDNLKIATAQNSYSGKDEVDLPEDQPFYIDTRLALSEAENNFFKILLYLAIPFLWLITWFRLRETHL